VTYEENFRWADAMGFPVALLEALSVHSIRSIYAAQITTLASSCATVLVMALSTKCFPPVTMAFFL
jgi:hypothetical protein